MNRAFRAGTLLAGLAVAGAAGCSNDDHSAAAKEAEAALGVPADKERTTAKEARDFIYIEEKKLVDKKSGEVVSDKKVETPVTIKVEKREKTDIDVNVGKPQAAAK